MSILIKSVHFSPCLYPKRFGFFFCNRGMFCVFVSLTNTVFIARSLVSFLLRSSNSLFDAFQRFALTSFTVFLWNLRVWMVLDVSLLVWCDCTTKLMNFNCTAVNWAVLRSSSSMAIIVIQIDWPLNMPQTRVHHFKCHKAHRTIGGTDSVIESQPINQKMMLKICNWISRFGCCWCCWVDVLLTAIDIIFNTMFTCMVG